MSPSVALSPLDHSEVFRYLGMTETATDAFLNERMQICEKKLLHFATPRYTYCILPLVRTESVLYMDTMLLEGNAIRNHLEGCDRAVLLAATLGIQVDQLIDRIQKRDMTNALLLDAMANVAIEQICDKAEQKIQETMPDCFFTWRFSAGYGDFPISAQPALLSRLNAARQLGITVTETHLMTPRKSVTAIFGCAKHPLPERRRGCTICHMREICLYRKKGAHCGGTESDL
jgi:5-methyltetrahydrofolate--homocysteine methyltransferase